MKLVLDCSITAAWIFEDESHPLADRALDVVTEGEAIVPSIWPIELASVLTKSVRRKRLPMDQLDARMSYLDTFAIQIEDIAVNPSRLAHLALDSGLTVYDAMYLDLARRHALPLATLDIRLSAAAAKLGVPLLTLLKSV